jgi:two-component system response regulator AtoC
MTTDRNQQASESHPLPPLEIIIGKTAAMRSLWNKLERIAATNVPVLLQGESGTGKDVLARLLHARSRRPPDSLIKVNCLAIPSALLETELFGYEKGAFTGAQATKRGRLEQAHLGTLFLDEIGSLDLAAQSKLLQVLEDGTFVRVGGHELRSIETRIVAAANGSLRAQVDDGTFRLDLLFRINAVTLNLLPLRQRIADLPALLDYFLEQYSRVFESTPQPLSRTTVQWMQNYHWPGNIRQLENLVRSYVLIGSEDALFADLIPAAPNANLGNLPPIDLNEPVSLKRITKRATQDLERQIIFKVLEANDGNRQKTARWLKISYRSLLYKLTDGGASPQPARAPRKASGKHTPPGGQTLSPGLSSSSRMP